MPDVNPLSENPKWKFNQPDLGMRGHYVAVDKEAGKKQAVTLEVSSTCREGVVNLARDTFKTRLTNNKDVQSFDGAWDSKKPTLAATRDCDLADPLGKKNPASLKIQWHASYMAGWEDFPIEEFLKVCNVVLGPISVLLSTSRPTGENWWKTDPKKCIKTSNELRHVYWNGTDSWFLAHPATVGIATGLYRQCFHLCGAGVSDEIIKSISEDEIEEVMSTNSQKLALLIIKRTRPWIEVPVTGNGGEHNYAFPKGFWRRLMRLQRAVQRHGYEESLGQSFHEGWATVNGHTYNGAYAFWGGRGTTNFTDSYRHLLKKGAPKGKASDTVAKKEA